MAHLPVASLFLTVVVLVAGCGSAATSPPESVSPAGSSAPAIGSPDASVILTSPTPVTDPSPSQSPVPTAAPLVGMSWQRIDDPDLDSGARNANMLGVLAAGPGALAWGSIYATGPHIWWSASGHDWQAGTIPPIGDAWIEEGYAGELVDVVGGGPGFVAVGDYLRKHDTNTAVVWTSVDGKGWQRVPDGPVFAHSFVQRVVVLHGELLAYGCTLAGSTDCAAPLAWSSTDGRSWERITPTLPVALGTLELIAASPDRLWGRAEKEYGDAGYLRPTILTSTDGRTWTISPLEWMAPMIVRALPDAMYALVPPMPTATDGFFVPDWWSTTPGIFRSADLRTWSQIGSPPGAMPKELIATGDTLILAGAAGKACWTPLNCQVAAWRSVDDGRTWSEAPVAKPDGSSEAKGGTFSAGAALRDGTLVGVGMTVNAKGDPSLAAWVSVPTAR